MLDRYCLDGLATENQWVNRGGCSVYDALTVPPTPWCYSEVESMDGQMEEC